MSFHQLNQRISIKFQQFALFIAIIAFLVGLLAWLRPRPVVARKQDLEERQGLRIIGVRDLPGVGELPDGL